MTLHSLLFKLWVMSGVYGLGIVWTHFRRLRNSDTDVCLLRTGRNASTRGCIIKLWLVGPFQTFVCFALMSGYRFLPDGPSMEGNGEQTLASKAHLTRSSASAIAALKSG